jgi:hypothetical protein
MLGAGSEVEKLVELADASLYASRRTVRPAPPRHPNRHRLLIAAAAASVIGLGSSSAFVVSSELSQAAVPTPIQNPIKPSGTASEPAKSDRAPRGESTPPSAASPPAERPAAGRPAQDAGGGHLAGDVNATAPRVILTVSATSTAASPVTTPAPVPVRPPKLTVPTPKALPQPSPPPIEGAPHCDPRWNPHTSQNPGGRRESRGWKRTGTRHLSGPWHVRGPWHWIGARKSPSDQSRGSDAKRFRSPDSG